jgi:hypothetical protein
MKTLEIIWDDQRSNTTRCAYISSDRAPDPEQWDERTFQLFLCVMCLLVTGQNESQALGRWTVGFEHGIITVTQPISLRSARTATPVTLPDHIVRSPDSAILEVTEKSIVQSLTSSLFDIAWKN